MVSWIRTLLCGIGGVLLVCLISDASLVLAISISGVSLLICAVVQRIMDKWNIIKEQNDG